MSDNPIAKFVRLQNGDDIIAEVVEMEDENGVVFALFNPLKVIYMPSETTGYLSIAFMPWVFPRICEQQEFIIHAEDVLLMNDVAREKAKILLSFPSFNSLSNDQVVELYTTGKVRSKSE